MICTRTGRSKRSGLLWVSTYTHADRHTHALPHAPRGGTRTSACLGSPSAQRSPSSSSNKGDHGTGNNRRCVFCFTAHPSPRAVRSVLASRGLDFGRSSRSDGGKKWLAEAAIRRCRWRLSRRTAVAGGFCERANRRGMVGDGYVSAGHPLFVAAADRLRHAERALSYRAQPPSIDAAPTPPRLC